MASMIHAEKLTRSYGDREALRQLDLEVPQGCCFGLFGPNGSGKTTFLKIVCTLIQPTSGRIAVAGLELPREADRVRARVGILLDRPFIPRDFSLREGLQFHADLHQVPDASRRIDQLVERVSLTWRVRDPLRTFSRGMAQRASLICALLPDPEILILDEPFTGLDREACRIVEEVVAEERQAGKTVLLVTHELERGARLADEVLVLERGEAAFRGHAGEWSEDDLLAVYQ